MGGNKRHKSRMETLRAVTQGTSKKRTVEVGRAMRKENGKEQNNNDNNI